MSRSEVVILMLKNNVLCDPSPASRGRSRPELGVARFGAAALDAGAAEQRG